MATCCLADSPNPKKEPTDSGEMIDLTETDDEDDATVEMMVADSSSSVGSPESHVSTSSSEDMKPLSIISQTPPSSGAASSSLMMPSLVPSGCVSPPVISLDTPPRMSVSPQSLPRSPRQISNPRYSPYSSPLVSPVTLSPASHRLSPTCTLSPSSHRLSPVSHRLSPISRTFSPSSHNLSPASHNLSPISHAFSPASHTLSPASHSSLGHHGTVSTPTPPPAHSGLGLGSLMAPPASMAFPSHPFYNPMFSSHGSHMDSINDNDLEEFLNAFTSGSSGYHHSSLGASLSSPMFNPYAAPSLPLTSHRIAFPEPVESTESRPAPFTLGRSLTPRGSSSSATITSANTPASSPPSSPNSHYDPMS